MKKTPMRSVMLDCSRDAVYTVETLRTYFKLLSEMGYNSVQLYTEDTYEIDGEPYFGYLRGRYSKAELRELDAIAASFGLELIPCIQTLAHLGGMVRWKSYASIVDCNDILLVGEPRTYELIEKMFRTLSECFTSRRVNIGMDEAHMVGLGKYLDRYGYENRFDILLRHLNRVNEIAVKYGFTPMMWSDMFFRLANGGKYETTGEPFPEEIVRLVPSNIELIYWDYYRTEKAGYDRMIAAHKQFKNPIIFAGGDWSWVGFAPDNHYSIRASRAAISACRDGGVSEIIMTSWGDDGAECSIFATLPALLTVAEYANGNFDDQSIAEKFKKLIGMDMETFLALDEINLQSNAERVCNPSKYMLYSDPFLGFLDYTVDPCAAARFTAIKEKLEVGATNSTFGYIFRTLADLSSVLELKYTLGLRTREAYRSGNRTSVAALLPDYEEIERRLKQFYAAFTYQWEAEAKPHGFEKQDLRIGGLIARLSHCRKILAEYAEGKKDRIESLEEDILTPLSEKTPASTPIRYNNWLYTANNNELE